MIVSVAGSFLFRSSSWKLLGRSLGAKALVSYSLPCCQLGGPHRLFFDVRSFGCPLLPRAIPCRGPGHDNGFGRSSSLLLPVRKLCEHVALLLATQAPTKTPLSADVSYIQEGKVHRHQSRGEHPTHSRELKQEQDSQAWAGMREPSKLAEVWPELWDTMALIAPPPLGSSVAPPFVPKFAPHLRRKARAGLPKPRRIEWLARPRG